MSLEQIAGLCVYGWPYITSPDIAYVVKLMLAEAEQSAALQRQQKQQSAGLAGDAGSDSGSRCSSGSE